MNPARLGNPTTALYMNQPTPDPSQEGSKIADAPSQFPSWEGSGVGSWRQSRVVADGGSRPAGRRYHSRRLALWAAVSFLVVTLTANGDEQTYIVQRNDT